MSLLTPFLLIVVVGLLGAAADDPCEVTVADVAGLTLALNTTCPNKTITFTRPFGSLPAVINVSLVVKSSVVLVCSGEAPHFTCPASAPCVMSDSYVDLEVRGCSLYGGAGVHVNGLHSLSLINVTVDMCRYKASTTTSPVPFGGGDGYVSPFSCVFVRNTFDLRIVGSTLSRGFTNTTVVFGAEYIQRVSFGGCLSVANTTRVMVTSSFITNCKLATKYTSGGCVGFYECGNVTVVNTLISQCKTTGTEGGVSHGGALFAEISTLAMRNCTVRDSSARQGGCVSLHKRSQMVVSDSRVTNCSSSEYGGAIHAELSSELTLFNSTVSNSTGLSGGCIYNYNSSVTVLSSLLLDCIATNRAIGGALFGKKSGPLFISETTFENAIAAPGVSCIFQQNNATTIANSTFIKCGAIETEFVTFTMTDSSMRTTDSSGPCLFFDDPTTAPRLETSDFSGCPVAYLIFNGSVLYTPPKIEKALWTLYETLWSDAQQTGMMIRQPMTVSRSYGACAQLRTEQQSPVTNDDGYAQCRSRWGATALCPLQTGAVPVIRILRSTVTGLLDKLQANRTLLQGRMTADGYEYSSCLYLDVLNETTLPPPTADLPSTPPPTTVERIARGTATGTAAISFIGQSVSLSSLLQPMVSNAFTAILHCGEYLPPDFFAHPVQTSIGGGLFGPYIGLVIFDLTFAFANLILYTMARGWARFPGGGLITWVFFYQPVTQYAARLALMAEGSLRAYGALVLAAQAAVCIGSFVVVGRGEHKSVRFKAIFSPYVEGRYWFITVELGMQFALSMISGYVSPNAVGCKVQAWILAVVLVGHGTVLIYFKVLQNAFEMWFVTLINILYIVCILLIALENKGAAKPLLSVVDFMMASFNMLCLARDIVILVRKKNARDARKKQIESARSLEDEAVARSLEDEVVAELSVEMLAHDNHRALKDLAQTMPTRPLPARKEVVHTQSSSVQKVGQTMPLSKPRPKFEL